MLTTVLLVISIVEFVALCAIGVYFLYKNNSKKIVKEKDGVRYTVDDSPTKDGKVQATFKEKDIILQADEVYKVGKENQIKPGRYNILSTQSGKTKVNLKVNAVRRSQEHNSEIIFAEGDIVIAENESVILR